MPASQIKRLWYRGFNKCLLSSMRKAHPQIVHYHALDRLLFVLVTVFLQGFVICFTSLGRRTEFTPPHRISSTKKKFSRDWVARLLPVFPIRLNIFRLPYFNMLFQFLSTVFLQSESFSCFQKGLYLDIPLTSRMNGLKLIYWEVNRLRFLPRAIIGFWFLLIKLQRTMTILFKPRSL